MLYYSKLFQPLQLIRKTRKSIEPPQNPLQQESGIIITSVEQILLINKQSAPASTNMITIKMRQRLSILWVDPKEILGYQLLGEFFRKVDGHGML